MTKTTALISPRFPLLQYLKSHVTRRKTWTVMGLAVFCTAFLAGCGNVPFEASIATKDDGYGELLTYLVLTSKVDDVVIKSVTVNRKNCEVVQYDRNPHLGFGGQFKTLVHCHPDQIKEAEVETNDGKYSFTF